MRGSILAALMAVVITFVPAAALAQGRGGLTLSTPDLRSTQVVGGNLTTYSYGLGGLRGPGTAGMPGGGEILRSNIYSSLSADSLGGIATSRLGLSDYGSGYSTGMPMLGTRRLGDSPLDDLRYTPTVPSNSSYMDSAALRGDGYRPGGSNLSGDRGGRAASGGLTIFMVQNFACMAGDPALTKRPDTGLTSFLPSDNSAYRAQMQAGEDALKQAKYELAASGFSAAATMARGNAEPLLNLMHAQVGNLQYHQAAYSLRSALKLLPELPAANVKVRGFFAPEEFDKILAALTKAAQSNDSDALTLLAYWQYFDGRRMEAGQTLVRLARNEGESHEFVQTFQAALEAPAKPTTSSAPTSAPAGSSQK